MSGVLGIDPGTRKAGYALLGDRGVVLARGIEPVDRLHGRLEALLRQHPVEVLALGAGTNAGKIAAALAPLGLPVRLVDERETTLRARRLYYAENPARGLQRLLPMGLRFPPRPIDDYAAEIIARRWVACNEGKTAQPS
ncbi:MAG TPA: pre-16S rRNA-processing nuclease YqgF [Candidatus Dormibacteraeota bacterium]|nr:pre-16S rRNA-processing nuclease YqgF [Candidatus Dormibacteraeota bacterium]